MDEIKLEGNFMNRLIETFLTRLLMKKFGKYIGFDLHRLYLTKSENDVAYNVQIDCDIMISKEDLLSLVWKDQNGSGTS